MGTDKLTGETLRWVLLGLLLEVNISKQSATQVPLKIEILWHGKKWTTITTKIVNLIPDLMVIKLILQNYSIRTLHFLDIAFWLDVFPVQVQNLMTAKPAVGHVYKNTISLILVGIFYILFFRYAVSKSSRASYC
jgi:hypothetical protein